MLHKYISIQEEKEYRIPNKQKLVRRITYENHHDVQDKIRFIALPHCLFVTFAFQIGARLSSII